MKGIRLLGHRERKKNGEILLKGHNVLVKQDEFERYSKQQYDC